jgi:hypothetical protein
MPGGNIHWRNFDRQLGEMPSALAEIASFFGFRCSSEAIAKIARGPLLSRYSKALEYDYSPELRRELLTQASARIGRRSAGPWPGWSPPLAVRRCWRGRSTDAEAEYPMHRVIRVLTDDEVAKCREIAASAPFADGRITNPHNSAKQNQQLHDPGATSRARNCSTARSRAARSSAISPSRSPSHLP